MQALIEDHKKRNKSMPCMRLLSVWLAGVWTFFFSAVLAAQELPDPERDAQRFQSLEQRIRDLEQQRPNNVRRNYGLDPASERLSTGDIEEALKSHAAKKASTRPTVSVFGRMHLETLLFPNSTPGIGYFENPTTGVGPENRIQFRRIRLGAQGDIFENGLYRLEFDIGHPVVPTIRDMYLGFEDLPIFQTVLIGNQKRPLGLDTWNSNQHVLFFERPLALNAFNPNFRRIGIQTYGDTADQRMNWQLGVFELQDVKDTGRYLGNSPQLSFNARVSGTPWYDEASGGRGYLHLGVSNMFADTDQTPGPPATDRNQARFAARPELQTTSPWIDTGTINNAGSYDVLGWEAVLNIDSLQIQGEYMNTWVNREADANLSFYGGYVQMAYVLTGEHEPWDRKMGRIGRLKPFENFYLVNRDSEGTRNGWGAFQLAARWSFVNLSDRDILGGREENLALALNWYWTPYSKMLLDVVSGQIRNRAPVGGYTGGHFTGLGLRFMMDF